MGREFHLHVLARAAEIETLGLLDRLDEAVQAGVLEELEQSGDYRFSHALIQETLYDELTTSRRIRLHATVGIALESFSASDLAPYYAELARHFSEAALAGNADKAIDYATRAGDQAMETTAWEAAARHYLQAVEIMDMSPQTDPRRQARMLIQIGRALHLSGAALFSSDAAVAFDRAVRLAKTHHLTEEFIEAVLDRAGTNLAIQYGGAEHVRLLEDALDLLEPGDSALRARLLTRLAVDQRALPDYQESTVKQMADEALAMARRVDDPSVLANALFGHAVANWGPDELAVRTHSINELLALHDAVSLTHADLYQGYGLQAAYALESGDLDLAGQALSSLAELAAQTPIRWARTFLNELRVVRALLVEDLPGAESAAEESTESKTQIEMIPWHLQHFLVLRREQDRLNELEEELSSIVSLLEQPIDEMPLHGLWPELRYYRTQLLIVHHEVANADLDQNRVRTLAHEYLADTERDFLWIISGCLLADICVAIGERDVAPSLYDVLLPYTDRVAVSGIGPFCVIPASVAHYLGLITTMLGRWSDAEHHFEMASAVQVEMPTSLAHTWHAHAAMLVERGDPGDIDRAQDLNEQALMAAQGLGMIRLERLATALADQIEAQGTTTDDALAYDLTPRELEVLGCLVRGSTDREIADELSISHRTVQVHVSNILGKLQAGSRTAAAAMAIREGLV